MNSNYMFAFNRGPSPSPSPSPGPKSLPSLNAGPSPSPSPKSLSNRFSINRLINYKSAGGCRSCN